MSIDKLNIRFNEPIYDQENIDKLKDKVNEVVDGTFDEDGKIDTSNLNKKLYFHPIVLENAGSTTYQYELSFVILSNYEYSMAGSGQPFHSFEGIKNWMKENNISTLLCNGIVNNIVDSKIFICSYIYRSGDILSIYGNYIDGSSRNLGGIDLVTVFDNPSYDNDGVNEIYPN